MNSSDFNLTCPLSLRWNLSNIDRQRPVLCVCILASITHILFWFQVILCVSLRQKNMQWLYAYLLTDILLLFQFFFIFIVRTRSSECTSDTTWFLFICYCEAFGSTYLNITAVYILLALNVCRYIQIAYSRNVYTTHTRLLICVHLSIYLMPIIIFFIQIYVGWAHLITSSGESSHIDYTTIYAQIFNTMFSFALPIILNILVIYLSVRYVHLTSRLHRAQHHISARDKYHRSLVIQFLVFYTIWLSLWSPHIIVHQFTTRGDILEIVQLLNSIEMVIDPIIIGALDIRFWNVWKNIWRHIKNRYFPQLQRQQRQILPIKPDHIIPSPQVQQIKSI